MAAAVLLLSGCAATAPAAVESSVPSPTATHSATATPTPTPTPTGTSPGTGGQVEGSIQTSTAAIRITGSGMFLEGADGADLESLSYFASSANAIDLLTRALGFAPVVVDPPAELFLTGPAYDFGGLMVIDNGPDPYAGRQFTVAMTAAELNGVALVALGDISVGDPMSDFTALSGWEPNPPVNGITVGYYGELPYSWANAHVQYISRGGSTITMIAAPQGA